jgi:hypothetical protein
MNEKQIIELIGGLNPQGVDAFNAYINYLYFASILEVVGGTIIVCTIFYFFYKLFVKMAE